MSIHQRIKQKRLALELSLKTLGEAVGVSWQTVQQWEKEGGTMPLRKRRLQLAAALKVTEEWLETGRADTGPGRTDDGRIMVPVTSKEELCLELFKKLTPEQQEVLLRDLRLTADANRITEKAKGSPVTKHVSNMEMELTYGLPSKQKEHPGHK